MTRMNIVPKWQRFHSLTQARAAFPISCCVYVQADSKGNAIRVGKQRLDPAISGRHRVGA
jgi:hypothetical protein